MKVLVTGGTGYIGSHTTAELLRAGYSVVVADNFSNSVPAVIERIKLATGKDFEFERCELCDAAACDAVFETHRPDAIIHFAGLKAVGESVEKPLDYYKNNLVTTFNLLASMKKYGVRNLVFSSSATVYGEPDSVPISETAPLRTKSPYGATKLVIENLLRDICAVDTTLNVALLRYFNPIGADSTGLLGEDPWGIPNNLLPYVAQVAVGRRPELLVNGDDYPTRDGTCVRDYVHVSDLALGHIAALKKLESGCGLVVYNLGTGRGSTVYEVVAAFERACGKKIPRTVVGRRAGDAAECYADVEKARRELGFTAERTLDDMCKDAWNFQKNNPDGYEKPKKPVLVVLAAGMGSRYGGCKQIDPVGRHGELIIDYSLFDARRAGFEDVVFIIKKAIEDDFKQAIGERISAYMNVSYAFQELDMLPDGVVCPEGRVKPFGTTHALLCARRAVGDRAFCVINADDYYGPEAYAKIYDYLSGAALKTREYAMVGYILGNTLTPSGTVARGICRVTGGMLSSIEEHFEICAQGDGAVGKNTRGKSVKLGIDDIASMNFWGFTPDVFELLERDFREFTESTLKENPLKGESLLPNSVGVMLKSKSASVNVLTSSDRWHGVTYKQDKPEVVAALGKLTDAGLYPEPLWK